MKSNYKRLGDYIQLVDERNKDLSINLLLGLSISKQFIPSVANTVGTNMKNYKIIRKGQFACSIMQVRRDGKMPVALLTDFEEKAFYDILKELCVKYDFTYPEDKLISLAQKVKDVVDDKAKYTDWSKRADIKAELKADLIILLAENDYPPVDRDEVYKEIFEQAENFKRYNN
ncbi:hypothetical protein GGE08_000359 [Muricauda sp. ARW1Y1]|nr:DUF3387 domain-containing protein [Muricauda sp. ARW1Y1]NYJ26327.1 hypothetical protein [Muricauda sp. ARW1Y1]